MTFPPGSVSPGWTRSSSSRCTVLVWRSRDHQVQQAALTVGDGWALHKPSQGWFDPVKVLTAADVKRSA
jgi:hypothetical protein